VPTYILLLGEIAQGRAVFIALQYASNSHYAHQQRQYPNQYNPRSSEEEERYHRQQQSVSPSIHLQQSKTDLLMSHHVKLIQYFNLRLTQLTKQQPFRRKLH
jgi:hypothetical protein